MLTDTHSHIYAKDLAPDIEQVIERSLKAEVNKILMPAIDSSVHKDMLEIEGRFPGHCLAMMGLHPCSVKEDYEAELKQVEDYFAQRKFVAVGETGLDFYWDLTFKEQQYKAFQRQAELALEHDIPLVIHSRNSTDECIEVVASFGGKLKGVFHCFSGSTEQAARIISLGFYLGIGGVLTFKNSGLDQVVKDIPLEHILLETDSPYLAPVPFRGKRNESSYLPLIAQKLADTRQQSLSSIAAATSQNAEKLFGL